MSEKECILECFYDKLLQRCGGCHRTLQQIKAAGKSKKEDNEDRQRNEGIYLRDNRRTPGAGVGFDK